MHIKRLLIVLFILISSNVILGQTKSQKGFVEIDDVKLYYEIKGEGDAVVLLHDGLINNLVWNKQFNFLSKHFKVIRYDRRGYGKSGISQKRYYDFDDLFYLLKKLDISKSYFVAISGGAGIVIDFAIKYPEYVNKMVLVGGVVNGFDYSKQFVNRNLTNMFPFIQKKDIKSTMENWKNDQFLVPNTVIRDPLLIDTLLSNSGKDLPNIFKIISIRENLRPAAIKRLDEISAPTLILIGENDIKDVKENADLLDAGIQNSKKIIIENSGHLVNLEKPNEFNSIVLKYFDE